MNVKGSLFVIFFLIILLIFFKYPVLKIFVITCLAVAGLFLILMIVKAIFDKRAEKKNFIGSKSEQ